MAAKLTPSEHRQRLDDVLDMRFRGHSYGEIAKKYQVSVPTIYNWLHKHFQEQRAKIDELRDFELARLDRLLRAHWDTAIAGDGEATDRVLRILDRRFRILGVEAPKKIDLRAMIMAIAAEEGVDPEEMAEEAEELYPLLRGA